MTVDGLEAWIGREEHEHDVIDVVRARRMHAFLDLPQDELQPGTPLPHGYHWLYCVSITPRAEWGRDGHARRGGFLPPLTGTRRMWAGGALRFRQPLHIGDAVERHSTIESIEEKDGRTGRFHLVRIAHRIASPAGIAIEEEQQLVYLPAAMRPSPAGGKPFTQTPDWQHTFTADEVALFYFSALTMNGHRIHYDYPYATREEAYPALLVHAPLTALLLLAAARRNCCATRTFEYRAVAPVFCGETITFAGKKQPDRTVKLWALRPDGRVAMEAAATC